MHHWNPYMRDIYFSTEKLESSRIIQRQWNIRFVVECQPHANHILFAHAWGGCDTTSATYRRGKTKILKQLESKDVRDIASIFANLYASQADIGKAGCLLALQSYGGKVGDTLSILRHAKFMGAITTSASLEPETLPPTERAMYYHSLRVHFQICQWKQLDLQCLKANEW